MADIRKNVAYTAIPVAALALAGLIMKKVAGKQGDGRITEEVKAAAETATKDIEGALSDLRSNVSGRTGAQIEKGIDSAVLSAKSRLDRIASQLKDRLAQQRGRAAA